MSEQLTCPLCGLPLNLPVTLAGRLRHCRLKAHKTLRQVESATGLSNAVISQIETGKVANPGVFTLTKLAAYYGTTVGELIDGLDLE